MKYAELLSNYVKSSGLSLSEISKRMSDRGMKIDKSYISKLQNGAANPPSTEITLALAEVLSGDPEQLAWTAMIDKNDPETFQKLMQLNKALIRKRIEMDIKYPIPENMGDMEADEYLDNIAEYQQFNDEFNKELNKLFPSSPETSQKLREFQIYLAELKQTLWDNFIKAYTHHMGDITSNKFSVRQDIPLIGTICAGDGMLAEQNIEEYICYPFSNKRQPDYALTVKGNSMIGAGIEDGDIVYMCKAKWAEFNGQIVAAIINGEEGTLKRMKWSEGSPIIQLVPENEQYETKEVYPNEVQICGVYIGHFKPENN